MRASQEAMCDIASVNPTARRTAVSFFFQAEDGIRDLTVTGVQTCALPIYELWRRVEEDLVAQRKQRDSSPVGVEPRVASRLALSHAVEIGLCLLAHDTRLEPPDDATVGMESPLGERTVGRGDRRDRHV